MWEQKQHLLPISATIVVFSNMDNKVAWKMSGTGTLRMKKNKNATFSKKVGFLTSLNIQHHIKRARNARNFCRTPKFSTSNIFCIFVKKSCYGFGRLRWTLTLRNLKILNFFEKFDIFENFENFRFWNFLKNFWILHPSKIHDMIWKISWYDIINMF